MESVRAEAVPESPVVQKPDHSSLDEQIVEGYSELPSPPQKTGWRRTGTVLIAALTVLLLVVGVGLAGVYFGLRDRATLTAEAAEMHYQRGVAYLAEGNNELAHAELEMALRLDPNNAEAAARLAEAQKALDGEANPTPAVREEVGQLYMDDLRAAYRAGNWPRVLELADLLRSVDPTYQRDQVEDMLFDALYESGLALVSEGRLEEAIRLFDEALLLRPTDSVVAEQRELAASYVEALNSFEADWEAALEGLKDLQRRAPDYLDVTERLYQAYLGYGEALAFLGDWCAAEEQFANAYSMSKSTEAARSQAQASDKCTLIAQETTTAKTPLPSGALSYGTFVGRFVELRPAGSDKVYVRGQILDAEGRGVDGVAVEIRAWEWSTTNYSSNNGYFSFDGLDQAVTYTLQLKGLTSVAVEVPTQFGSLSWVVFEESAEPSSTPEGGVGDVVQ